MMKLKHLLLVLYLLGNTFLPAQVSSSLRSEIYEALASEDIKNIEVQINRLSSQDDPNSHSFRGALLMKKAAILRQKKEKLHAFKGGRDLLETVISKHPQNPEYRFLRLMIQENAPPILKYKTNIEEDLYLLKESFNKMPPESQTALKNYSKESPLLKNSGF